jgi:hypothetical protein
MTIRQAPDVMVMGVTLLRDEDLSANSALLGARRSSSPAELFVEAGVRS